jgi:HNH endonuclease
MNRKKLRDQLYIRDNTTKCHYWIEESDFLDVWKGPFYKTRGKKLEVDHKDNSKGDEIENCVLACALCNCAKSNKFTYEQFERVGAVIHEIWQQRKAQKVRGQI